MQFSRLKFGCQTIFMIFFSVSEIILCLRLYFEVDICLEFRLSKQIIIPLGGKIGWIKTKKGHFNSFNRSFLNAKSKKKSGVCF